MPYKHFNICKISNRDICMYENRVIFTQGGWPMLLVQNKRVFNLLFRYVTSITVEYICWSCRNANINILKILSWAWIEACELDTGIELNLDRSYLNARQNKTIFLGERHCSNHIAFTFSQRICRRINRNNPNTNRTNYMLLA